MGTKICSLGLFQEPHHNSKKSQKLMVRGKLVQKPRAASKKSCELLSVVKNLFNFENMDPHPFSDCTDHNAVLAVPNYNGRVGFSKMLYVGFISILMKAVENFNGVHTRLMWKTFERLYISSLSDLLFWLTKLWAHRYIEPGPRILYTFCQLVKDSWKELGHPKTLLISALEAGSKTPQFNHYWAEDESYLLLTV